MRDCEAVELQNFDWCWFYSDWHRKIVMGQIKEIAYFDDILINDKKAVKRVWFFKVLNTDGSHADWTKTDTTSVGVLDIVKRINIW